MDRRMGGPQSRSGRGVEEKGGSHSRSERGGEEENSQPLAWLELPIIQPVDQCYKVE
jgi:hypothetical protein